MSTDRPVTSPIAHAPAASELTAAQWRQQFRRGLHTGHTSGLAAEHVQGNVVILPAALADDFRRFCELNPKPCPLLAAGRPGDPTLPELGADIDLRTDLPRYRVWRDGELVDEPTDVRDLWREDLVSFVLGCSFSFEWALERAGIPLRHVQLGRNVAMYRTNLLTIPVGAFHGPTVVSMRPVRSIDLTRVFEITARFPQVHGAPIHIGDPSLIGIRDLAQPDYGDAVAIESDEVPVFWACGVTPQAAITRARPAFCITHAPGAMLITDLFNHQLALPHPPQENPS